MLLKTKIRFLLLAVIFSAFIFTTCETPMGMGDQIDWEPPVLKVDSVSNPFYARPGSFLAGTVTDNVGVIRVAFTNSATGEDLFPVVIDGNRWKVNLTFSTEEWNGVKFTAQIAAYDKAGNSGEASMTFVTIIVDTTPPVLEYIEIKRTDTRLASIEPYANLKALETSDPEGKIKANLYKYQNGTFYINGQVSDKETRVFSATLDFYDYKDPSTLLLSLPIDDGYTPYYPRWTVKEEVLINAGVAKFGSDYKTDYYENKARYYYRVVVNALDMAENRNIVDEEGYICLWAEADKPRGVPDAGVGTVLSKGSTIPVDFYDDDSLYWAYAGLLTQAQWNGTKPVASGASIPQAYNDTQKLRWLKERLTGATGDGNVVKGSGQPVYNWNYDLHNTSEAITDQIGYSSTAPTVDDLLIYVQTGNNQSDYGYYVLFTLAADKKLPPHDGSGAEWTSKDSWTGTFTNIQIIDENVPLIVFDTTDKTPEENTFPDPLLSIGGSEEKYFIINGYTLRHSQGATNSVTDFRMAWIPFNMPGGADRWIPEVKEALTNNSGYPTGVQFWNFTSGTSLDNGNLVSQAALEDGVYRKQSFRKQFSVMKGETDNLKPAYQSFTYNSVHENETKLFIFYAKDNHGHEVFRQLRLLGWKEVPEVSVYDITNKLPASLSMPSGLPNPNDNANWNQSTASPTTAYYSALNDYNKLSAVTNILRDETSVPKVTVTDDDLAKSFQVYPRETVVKFRVSAQKAGKIPIESITMKDITYNDKIEVGSPYNTTTKALSFCEYYPDVTQRTFLFEATDKLGNIAQFQRTIAVTNAARLERITTTSQSGDYGIGNKITLRAEFTGSIYIDGGVKPGLYVRYQNASPPFQYIYELVECTNSPLPNITSPTNTLEFEFTVPEGSTGKLETMFENLPDSALAPDKRPIYLGNATTIMDQNRKESAFIPGYTNTDGSVSMPNWLTAENTLQGTTAAPKKNIKLDGVRPKITIAAWGGKTPYTDGNSYFKNGEEITLTLTADKEIRASGTSTLQFQIRDSGNNLQPTGTTYYTAAFKYLRPGSDKKTLVYGLTVNAANCPFDGQLTNISLYTGAGGNIVDNVDNTAAVDTVNTAKLNPATNFYIKKAVPPAPAATLGTTPFASAGTYFNGAVNLVIPNSAAGAANFPAWDDRKQYSTDGGLTWLPNPPTASTGSVTVPLATPGPYKLQVRYLDRAGNEGNVAEKSIEINDTFPQLISVNTVQAKGYYTAGKNLSFSLNFADTVSVNNPANVSITLKNRAASTTVDEEHTLTLTAVQTDVTTITFNWNNITGKEMREGVYISNVDLGGLRDKFGIIGPTGTATCSASAPPSTPGTPTVISINSCPNLSAGVIVDAIAPTVNTRVPAIGNPASGTNTLVRTITLTFREPVMKGSGTITIRPHTGYAVPPVLEDEGYYLGYTSNGIAYTDTKTGVTAGTPLETGIPTKFYESGTDRTYISSFYDIYNASTTANRTNLTQGSSMSNLTLNARTGQSAGPYKKMTHGLVLGAGYSGAYTTANPGADGPNLATTAGVYVYSAMVPDTATKWVLDYRYGITQNVTAVTNIRNALSAAKWRWQEIDVVNTTIGSGSDANVVTITLNEPLLKGLEWDVYYPAGAFTDMAGNSAPKSGNFNANGATDGTNTDYYFVSPGVQAPVIRVNRRSYDGRNSGWQSTARTYNPPGNTNWDAATQVTDDNGWGIGDFNTVHYRVESESSAVTGTTTVTAQYFQGAAGDASVARGAWTGSVAAVNGNGTPINARDWDQGASNTAGEWVMPNIIRRSRNGTNQTYRIITKNGTPESRESTGTLRMFKSYNRDLTRAQLGWPTGTAAGVTLTTASLSTAVNTYGQAALTYQTNGLEAGKSYIIGTASLNGVSAKGVEGVFRTVIVLNYSAERNASNYIAVEGSNIKNGMPSIAGFPVRDAEETGDNRFIKLFFADQSQNRQRYYWVSTEIVSEWYFLSYGGGSNGTHQNVGEVNNYQMIGYGDLTYGYNITWY
jgi:hypothetical protein